jgi:serine/threonine protein kinase/tetratricopeptide (TPR) repeat protein
MTTDELVDEIFGRCRERMERGEAVDVDDLLRVHADIADALRERFAAARLLDRAVARNRRGNADAATRVGAVLGPYRVEAVLGTGGMGTVYLARVEAATEALASGARVAVKVFHAHLVTRDRFTARFLREAELGRRVRHANVVRTLEAGETTEADRTVRFLVMEHVEGMTLRALLAELGRLPEELCRHVGREVAKGLAAIHAAGAVHRDLKPENVIVTRDHAVKVMDLGVARVEDAATLSETGAFIGSLRYGAPEQFLGGADVDARADLHALGVLLHELATGRHPFAGVEYHEVVRQVLDVRPRRLGEIAPQVSPFLEELVARLLEKDPDRRPASAAEVATILDRGEESAWWKARAVALRRETRRPLRRIRIPRETALYGRDVEISRLRELFEKAKSGDGRVVLVEGEAGIGKSRLVDEFVMSLWTAGEDIDFLVGSYPPGGAATASGAFTTAYRAHLGDDEASIRDALPQTPLLVPAFAALLRGDAPPEGAEKPTKDSIQTLFVHATRSFAARRTTIVLVDDLHFAPEDGRGLFMSLALATPGHRILLLGGARRSLDEKWAAGFARLPNASRLPLDRLSPKDLVELLEDALRSRHLAEELGGKIAAKSDGNPFFVFEILRGLREGQFLTKKPDGTWITTRVIREIEIPPSIVEVIQARVSDLGADERNVLEVAACIGFEFDAALVGAVLGVAPIPLLQRLGRIEKARRLVRSVGHLFDFDHHQVQEVLYAGLSAPLREAYHAAIAEAIESRSGAASKEPNDLDGALCVDLAEHLLKGAQGSRSLRYLDAALTHLEKGWHNDGAVRLADRALAAPGLIAGRERAELLLRKTARLDVLSRRDAERAALDEAVLLADAAGEPLGRAQARRALGWHLIQVSHFAEAQAALGEALDLARDAGDRKEVAAATGNLGSAFLLLGRYAEAQTQYERQLALAREIGDRRGESAATGNLGIVFQSLGRLAAAQAQHERQLALAREIGDRRAEGFGTKSLGNVFRSLGRFAEAQTHHERSLALARETGDRLAEGFALGNLGLTFCSLGRYADAQAHCERHLALARESGDRRAIATATGNLGDVFCALGRFAEAQAKGERWLALAQEIEDRRGQGYALACLAAAADERGDAAAARGHAEGALILGRGIGDGHGLVSSLLRIADLRRRSGEIDAARAALDEALPLARSQGTKGAVALCLAHLAALPGGEATAALAALAEAGDAVEVNAAAQIRLLLWQATRDRAHLAEAKRLLDFMVEHAPPECRESMLANVRLHREITAAWRAEFPEGGQAGAA